MCVCVCVCAHARAHFASPKPTYLFYIITLLSSNTPNIVLYFALPTH